MANSDPIKELSALLTSSVFSRQNAEKVARVCYDAARLVYERQKRSGKSALKTKEVSNALLLAETLHASAFRFVAEGALLQLFGEDCSEETAIEYFEKSVMGNVTDKYGRNVVIDEDGVKSLYKERTSGAHIVSLENYEEVRGKRLPWIRHTIENSDAVYVEEEPIGRSGIRRKYFYTAIVTFHIKEHEYTSYYVVLAREGKNQVLKMVTAFSMFERNGFLHTIAVSQRYVQQNRRVADKNPPPGQEHQIPIAKIVG
jgi:hypothetical protein